MTDEGITAALVALEERVDRALSTGDEGDIDILGYGEISSVLACDTPAGRMACKRLPLFDGADRVAAYSALFRVYLDRLRAAGVEPVRSTLYELPRPDGQLTVYCVQPVLDADGLAPRVLERLSVAEGSKLFEQILDGVFDICRDGSGIDAQLQNWALADGRLVYMDVTTPFLRDARGRDLLDTEIFVASLPWALRKPVLALAVGAILEKWYHPRGAVLDLLGNLIKEGLSRWIPSFVAATNRRLRPEHGDPLTVREVERYYAGDARLWGLLQLLRRADRAWQVRVRRRPYQFLLPGKIARNV
ncbi:MAG: DUF6206 family protein [bacterium]